MEVVSRAYVGEETLWAVLPAGLEVLLALVTQLGDVWLLAAVLAVLYWGNRELREGVAVVIGLFVAGLAAYRAVKATLALPRPAGPSLDPASLPPGIDVLFELTASASGYGFPSGHATNVTVVALGLALVVPYRSRRQRLGIAAGAIAVVGASRVLLGLHYVVDVIAGIALGLVIVGIGWWVLPRLGRDWATNAFALGVGLSAGYLWVATADILAWALAGAAVGGLAGWQFVLVASERIDTSTSVSPAGRRSIRGLLAVLALSALVLVLVAGVVAGAGDAILAGGIGLGALAFVAGVIVRDSPQLRSELKRG